MNLCTSWACGEKRRAFPAPRLTLEASLNLPARAVNEVFDGPVQVLPSCSIASIPGRRPSLGDMIRAGT